MKPGTVPVAVVVSLVSTSLVSLGGQQSVFRARTDVVAIDVAVTDGKKTVSHLTARDFDVRDMGVVQTVLDFARERQPLDLTLCIDLSSSMHGAKLASVQRAIAQIGAGLEPSDRAELVTFGTHVAQHSPLTAPPIVATLRAGGGLTSVFDAVLLSLVTAPTVGRRHLTVLMTDGDDSASEFTSSVVRETARYASTQMTFVLTRGNSNFVFGNRLGEVISTLRAVATTTGGEVVEISRDDELSAAFLAAIDNFRTSYVLRYVPAGVDAPGWHDVSVSVKGKKYSVRARRGYWATLPQPPDRPGQ